ASERGRDLVYVAAAQELPGEMTRDRSHHHAVSARDDRGGFFERREVPRPAVTVGDEDVAEAGPRQRAAVVDHRVAHDALTDAHGADGVERERAERERRGQQGGPAGPRGGEALGEGLGEVARGDRVA